MLTAYVDLKKAFDSVHSEALWDLLQLRDIPAGIIGLLFGRYYGTESAMKCGGGVSSFFLVHGEVRQGCDLAPSLQYMYGLGTGQSCGPVTVEHLSATPRSLIMFLLTMQ